MAVPTSPYCTTADVALLLLNLAPSGDFSDSTVPTRTVVESWAEKFSHWIETKFAQIGFYMPWQELTGEDWPEYQTATLLLMCAFGTAGAIGGPALKPAPALGPSRGVSRNVYTTEFNRLDRDIRRNGLGFRALYRVGSEAEEFVREPMGPVTDYLLGYVDPTRYQTTFEYTELFEKVRRRYSIPANLRPWDHMAENRRALIGI